MFAIVLLAASFGNHGHATTPNKHATTPTANATAGKSAELSKPVKISQERHAVRARRSMR